MIKLIIVLLIMITACSSKVSKEEETNTDNISALNLLPSYELINDTTMVFMLEVTRLLEVEEEYFPDSEGLQIKIFGKKGNVLWNSGENHAFLTAIFPVLPEKIGESHTYKIYWDMKNKYARKVPQGVYDATYILNSMPNKYSINLEVTIED